MVSERVAYTKAACTAVVGSVPYCIIVPKVPWYSIATSITSGSYIPGYSYTYLVHVFFYNVHFALNFAVIRDICLVAVAGSQKGYVRVRVLQKRRVRTKTYSSGVRPTSDRCRTGQVYHECLI